MSITLRTSSGRIICVSLSTLWCDWYHCNEGGVRSFHVGYVVVELE